MQVCHGQILLVAELRPPGRSTSNLYHNYNFLTYSQFTKALTKQKIRNSSNALGHVVISHVTWSWTTIYGNNNPIVVSPVYVVHGCADAYTLTYTTLGKRLMPYEAIVIKMRTHIIFNRELQDATPWASSNIQEIYQYISHHYYDLMANSIQFQINDKANISNSVAHALGNKEINQI